MILEEQNFKDENTILIGKPAINENMKDLQDKIETALNDSENLKVINPKISWSSKNMLQDENENKQGGDEIVFSLCYTNKLPKIRIL